jgi:hypothetical protein
VVALFGHEKLFPQHMMENYKFLTPEHSMSSPKENGITPCMMLNDLFFRLAEGFQLNG